MSPELPPAELVFDSPKQFWFLRYEIAGFGEDEMDVLFQRIPKGRCCEVLLPLIVPTVYDRVCQQALLNRLEPIFESVFDEASFGYRRGGSAKDALRKIWGEVEQGFEWVVDADLKDFLGSADHVKEPCNS